MTLPNFFILGTAKAGTTSLANYLRQHPQIFIPKNKEPNFFMLEGCQLPPFAGPADTKTLYETIYRCSITDIESYKALYQGVQQETAIGDATVLYLYFPKAADRIQYYIPEAKMIIILRNPIDRLYSHFLMVKEKYCLEPLDLMGALAQEEERIAKNWGWDWHYANIGLYYNQLKYYFDKFHPTQFKVFLYEDFCCHPLNVIQEIFRHIGVDDAFKPNILRRSKVAYMPRNKTFDRLINKPNRLRSCLRAVLPSAVFHQLVTFGNRMNQVSYKPLPPEIRHQLQQRFRPDILKVQDLIQRDLSMWYADV